MYHIKPRRHTQKIAVNVAPTKMLQTKGESMLYRQIIAAEIAFGLLLCTAYRIIFKIIYQQDGSEMGPANTQQLELTRSLVCVWLASNIKFILFKCDNRLSLSAHSASRLIAFLALLLEHCYGTSSRGLHPNQVPTLDMMVYSFFLVSSLVLFSLDLGNNQETARSNWNTNKFYQNMTQLRSGFSPQHQNTLFSRIGIQNQSPDHSLLQNQITGWQAIQNQRFVNCKTQNGSTSSGIQHQNQSSSQKFFLQMDVGALLVFGLLWLTCPDWLLCSQTPGSPDVLHTAGSQDVLHLHLTRALGAMMVGDSCVSLITQNLQQQNFKQNLQQENFKQNLKRNLKQQNFKQNHQADEDKCYVFVSRTAGCLLLLVFMLHFQVMSSSWSPTHLYCGLLGACLWTGNSILGYISSKHLDIDPVS
ncbi:uncharacterized protein LOC134015146 isoform X2 [Osmerus eperlanus]|uniref:uncharacterized protein LOC134015146 isoform X2 n=1 Tax=Osmerus eperlanus TaxID=29151 RepID=UPI002E0D3A2B